MQLIVLCCVCVLSVMGQDIERMGDMPKYDSRYDYLDVDALFNSKRLVRNYVECLINGQRCTPEGKALKRLLPEALRTKCVRCSERQKRTAVKIIKRLKYEYPEEWAKLASKWDPTGDFTRYFEVFIANEHFNTISGSGNVVPVSPLALTTLRPLPPSVSTTQAPLTNAPPLRPLLLNRFGGRDEVMVGSSSSAITTPRPTMPFTMKTIKPSSATVIAPIPPRPTPVSWMSVAADSTRFTLRPTATIPLASTAITFIDQIGIKIIRTTELVTDILRNTVRAVVG